MFFQLWWWFVRLIAFTFGMPWRKEGKCSGKGKPQRAHYSGLVCHHLAPMQCRVAQRFPYFTPGKQALSWVSHTSQASPALKRRQLPQLWNLHLCPADRWWPSPSRCSAHGTGARGKQGQVHGQGCCLLALGLFNCWLIKSPYLNDSVQSTVSLYFSSSCSRSDVDSIGLLYLLISSVCIA